MQQVSCIGAIAGAVLAIGLTGCGPAPDYYEDVVEPHEVVGQHISQTTPEESTPERATPAVDGSLFGRWTGVGHQNDGAKWAMEVDITRADQGPCAVVRYPDLGCAGFWTCTAGEDGSIRAVERITDGRERCADRVDVDVHLGRGGALIFNAATGDIRAEARLQRAD